MKAELTRVLWVWGPVTQYQILLKGIDSAGHGASDVMEVCMCMCAYACAFLKGIDSAGHGASDVMEVYMYMCMYMYMYRDMARAT